MRLLALLLLAASLSVPGLSSSSEPGPGLSPGLSSGLSSGLLSGSPGRLSEAEPSRAGEWPLAPRPRVVSGFDPPATRWGAGHRGVDLLGHAGQRVRSSLKGTVTFAAPLAGRGVVVVDHGGVRTTYEPVSAGVQVGDPVEAGGVLGTLQLASSHCFPRACLHWGLRRGESYLNPLTLVGAGPLRLLPFSGTEPP